MAATDYAIVCDATCDLPDSFLSAARVERVAGAAREAAGAELERAYRDLAARGFARVVSLHSCAVFSTLVDAARDAARACADVAEVAVVDSGSASVATGMLVDRAARYRHFGVPFEGAVRGLVELAERVRLLVVPSASAPLARRRRDRGSRMGLLARASASVRVRIAGERGLYLLSGGELTQLARGADVAALSERLARALGSVSEREGALAYAVSEAGDARVLRAFEAALAASGLGARALGTVRASELSEAVSGTGSLSVALAAEDAYDRPVESLHGLGSHGAPATGADAPTDNVSSAQQISLHHPESNGEPKPFRT